MSHIAYIHTGNGLSVFLGGKVLSIARTDTRYEPALAVLHDPAGVNEEALNAVLAPPAVKIQDTIKRQELTDSIAIVDGELQYKGVGVHNTLASRILEHEKLQYDLKPLLAFLDNVMQNPSYRAVQDLYTFLEVGGIPITSDGHFLAYKYVRDDFKDVHSGTFDNTPGNIVEMPRNQVDENPNRTCSRGLHVCSYEYLGGYSHAAKVVLCKINPKDVVAIPADYNSTKMRVCRYEVVAEVDDPLKAQGDFLRGRAVTDEWDSRPTFEDDPDAGFDASLPYSIKAFDSLGDSYEQGLYDDEFEDYGTARDAALEALDEGAAKVVIYDGSLVYSTHTQP